MGLAQEGTRGEPSQYAGMGGRRNERRVEAYPIEGLGGIWPMGACGDCHGGFVVGQMWWDYPERADG